MESSCLLAILAVTIVIGIAVVILLLRANASAAAAAALRERQQQTDGELATMRDARAASDQRVAVAEEKLTRLSGLEQELKDTAAALTALRETKAQIDSRLAAAEEAVAREERTHHETKVRLAEAERQHGETQARAERLRDEKGKIEESLAARIEAATAYEKEIADLRLRLTEALQRNDATLLEAGQLKSDLATLNETLVKERQHAGEKLALLLEAKEQMTREFKLLADGVLQQHGEAFSKQNKEQIDATLVPLREKLAEYHKGLQDAHTEGVKERATLAEQIRTLSDSSARMSTETVNLTRALKGNAQTQGAWGEMILGTILERSGLREGEHYTRQESHATEDGSLRSDVIVNLPNGDRMVVDAKVSLSAFDAHVTAEDDLSRADHLKLHVGSLKTHIKGLSAKEYHAAAGSRLDFVIMFVPIEGALAAALKEHPDLTHYAVENNVAIATPTTLMIALRTAASIWKVEQRNRSAEEIANAAGRLYDKFVSFTEALSEIGNRLDQAKAAYDKAQSRLSTGRGHLVGQVERLKTLGARTGKSLSPSLLQADDPANFEPSAEPLAEAAAE